MRVAALLLLTAAGAACGGDPGIGEVRATVVYGRDDRRAPGDYPAASAARVWARSSAIEIDVSRLGRAEGSGFTLVAGETLSESMRASGRPLCPGEPFAGEPVLGGLCSAFLAGADVVVTAAHCVPSADACPYLAYVFGCERADHRLNLDLDDVYFCKRVAKRVTTGGADYAVVKVDRPVIGRAPLPLRREGRVEDDEELVLIGNPLGLPTKIAEHGRVLDNTAPGYFEASVDGYGGASGSVVIGARSGLVEGVLARGEDDFVREGDCWASRVCPEAGSPYRGEEVSRAAEIAAAVASANHSQAPHEETFHPLQKVHPRESRYRQPPPNDSAR